MIDLKTMRYKPVLRKAPQQSGAMTLRHVRKDNRWNKYQINKFWDHLENLGRFSDGIMRLGNYEGVKDVWKDEPCYIIGGGVSARGFDFNLLNGKHTIVLNHMIDVYDKCEWFLFQDQRFMRLNKYDFSQFKGKIFAHNNTRYNNADKPENVVLFKSNTQRPTENIEDGLYGRMLTGIAGLNLAIISGANPIYLLGMDQNKEENDFSGGYHYTKDYTGESKTKKLFDNVINRLSLFDKFKGYEKRIINVCENGRIDTFKKIKIEALANSLKKEQEIKINQIPKICHMITMENMDKMGTISREIYNKTYGKHTFCSIDKIPPKADIYLLECFLNKKNNYVNFIKPYTNSKAISILHSASSCKPAKCSDKVISLTTAYKKRLEMYGIKSDVIEACIDYDLYAKQEINYANKNFGRITRHSPGKVNTRWSDLAIEVLNKYEDAKCFMMSNNYPNVVHERFIIDRDITIGEESKKAERLSRLSLFTDMHGTFLETFSLALLEAMACGLPIVLHSIEPQISMYEIIGDNGFICSTPQEFKDTIIKLLPDAEKKKEYGLKAKARAKEYSIDKMIGKYNKLFKGIL